MLRKGWICLLMAGLALAGCGGDDDNDAYDTSTGSMGGSSVGGSAPGGSSAGGSSPGGTTSGGGGGSAGSSAGSGGAPLDRDTAAAVEIDRFSEQAGTLMVRDDDNDLPEAGQPVDFDQGPFITTGFGPDGEVVRYYNFDVQSTTPAPIYALFRRGEDMPVPGQLNIVGVIPGDDGYSDFWRVNKVTVPDDYEANTITSVDALMATGYDLETLDVLVNCPVVPNGSSAELSLGGSGNHLVRGWYDDQVVYYFSFEEAPLEVASEGAVPTSPIYVTFNINPNDDGGGPPSGFMTEAGSDQTHNVVATLPEDSSYSPLWLVNMYDNTDFDAVSDLDSALDANLLVTAAATVNCPIVSIAD